MTSLRISQLAERSGVPTTTLRYYDSAGLLPAERSPAGYRVYDARALERLEFISSAKFLGLSLEEIADLLGVWEQGVCASVRERLAPLVRARIADADGRIAELAAFSAHLTGVQAGLRGPAPAGACAPGCGCVRSSPGPILVELLASRPDDGPAPEDSVDPAPIACSLTGAGQAQRTQEWRTLLAAATERETLPDGRRFRFSPTPALARSLARLAAAESDCCRFFDFTLHFGADALTLTVRAPDGAGTMLEDLFGAAA